MNASLAQLQPLIYPATSNTTITWWQVLLALLAILLAGVLVWRKLHSKQPLPTAFDLLRQQALEELAQILPPHPEQPASLWLQQLNQLLKRLCNARYPEHNSHRLSGRLWLAFLDSRCPAAGLTRWMVLVEGAYQPSCQLSAKSIEELQAAVRLWIEKHA